MSDFYQSAPQISNTFSSDLLLQKFLQKRFPQEVRSAVEPHLRHLGERAATDLLRFAADAEAHPPVHIPYDPWGRRIDALETSAGWKNLEKAAAEEGIVATAYERKFAQFSRLYQMALLYLYSPSSAIYSCPLAMTDGGARCLELYGDDFLRKRAWTRLTSRDPKLFWTSGQWMTERTGGSDVSGTSTVAKEGGASDFGGNHLLYGTKWFTSATTSQMALTLARPEGAPEGSKGLALFYLELRDQKDHLQNIQIHRLKDKLGTKALPTAELSLLGTPARQLSAVGEGVKRIANLLNITRIYNSICALGHMRRCLDLAQDYSRKRVAFGKKIIDHPLHALTLAELEADFRKSFVLAFFVAELLGKEETGQATENEKILLRALTPVVKLFTGKKAVQIASEVVEVFGGAGYIEDTGIPRLLREAQVFPIWEGTTNILSLDMLRSFEKEKALPVILEFFAKSAAAQKQDPRFMRTQTTLLGLLKEAQSGGELKMQELARQSAFALAETLAAALEFDLSL